MSGNPTSQSRIWQTVRRAGDTARSVSLRLSRLLSSLSLGRLLSLIVLVTALPLLLASYLSFARLSENQRRTVENSLMLSAKVLAGLVDNEIDTHYAVVKTLALSQALESGDLAMFWQEARRAVSIVPGAWLTLNDAEGKPLLSTLVPYGSAMPARANASDVLQALRRKNGAIRDLEDSLLTGRKAAFIDVPVYDDTTPKYILSMSLDPQRFYALIKDRFTHGEIIGILDRNGRFVARLPDNEGRVGTFPSDLWRSAIGRSPEGFTFGQSLEGVVNINAYTQSALGWTIGVGQYDSAVFGPRRSVLETTAWTVGLLTALSLGLATIIARRLHGGMERLARAAERLGEGQPVPALAAPFKEADAIAQALRSASAEVAHAQAHLEARVAERTRELADEMARREQVEAQARQLLRMQAIGQLTGGIAHDFNNMLAIVISSLNLVKRRLASGRTDVDELIAGGIDGARRAADLTQRLLAFARQQPLVPEPLDASKLVRGLSELIPRSLGEHIKVETVLGGGTWTVYADASQLENAILNLAVNARDAMPEGGKLTIETSNSYLDDDYVRGHGDLAPGQYVLIAVTDTGCGMSADCVAQAFEPFFTTKPAGMGTGLGLSQVYGFVKQSRGHAKIYSEPGHGTTVKIYLPRYSGDARMAAASDGPRPQLARGSADECILVVEDDAGVRRMSAETLRELGYRVLEADSASSAIHHLEKTPDIALLFTDIVMPDVNGRKLADQAVSLNPKLKVLFTTGFSRNAIIHNGTLDAGVNLIAKPFSIENLSRKVRDVLDT